MMTAPGVSNDGGGLVPFMAGVDLLLSLMLSLGCAWLCFLAFCKCVLVLFVFAWAPARRNDTIHCVFACLAFGAVRGPASVIQQSCEKQDFRHLNYTVVVFWL